MTWRLSPLAEDDLARVAGAIAADNPLAAQGWIDRMERAFEALSAMPLLGTARDEVRPGLRVHPVGRYLILYRVADGVEVVRVIHGARLWQRLI